VRAVVQRVSSASVTVDGTVAGQIGRGFLILICAMQGDTEAQADKLASKIAKLRVFRDDAGKMNLSIKDIAGSALIVSQFTLAADLRGNRPGFSTAASPVEGKRLYDYFTTRMAQDAIPVANGIFGADMAVALVNDGPVTIWMDTDAIERGASLILGAKG
jgi:D-aminoacyl-tRNA deacylase